MSSHAISGLRVSRTADGGYVVQGVAGGALRARPHREGFVLEVGGTLEATLDPAPADAPGWILRGGPTGDEELGRTTRPDPEGEAVEGTTILLADGRCFRLAVRWVPEAVVDLLGLEGPGEYLRARPAGGEWRATWSASGSFLRGDRALEALFTAEIARLGPQDPADSERE